MPIRINLLAEFHALEEERRRDPVKRAYLVAGVILGITLGWSGILQLKVIGWRSQLSGLETKWTSIAKDYERTVEEQRKLIEAERKLTALQNLTTNRFLWGTALNALQHVMNGIDDVQVTHLKCAQVYAVTEATKPTTRGGVNVPARPAQASERVTLLIHGTDASGPQPGSMVNKFKQGITKVSYFENQLKKTNGVLLTSLSAPQLGANGRQPFVTFSVQCDFPEKVR